MSAHPISGRQARAQLGATQSAVNKQASAVVGLHERITAIEQVLIALRRASFWQRLKFLAVGR